METKPEISIIIPVYNVEKYLTNCLKSLLIQTYSNWEAILVDDGSTDNSGVICDHFAKRDGRFRVIHKENGGLSSARNIAIPQAKGDYIFFLDSDDFIAEYALERLIGIANQYDADMVQCDFSKGVLTSFPSMNQRINICIFDSRSVFVEYAANAISCAKLISRSVIDGIRFPEGLRNEDDFTTWKFYYNANRIAITSEKLYYYTDNPSSIMANLNKIPNLKYFEAYRERIRFFQEENEPDLEVVSRVQWMKCIVLQALNPKLASEQRNESKTVFNENYIAIRNSGISIPIKLRVIFALFRIMPKTTSRIVNKLK